MTSLEAACLSVLQTEDASCKAIRGLEAVASWKDGHLQSSSQPIVPPDRPKRPKNPSLLPPKDMPRRRLGSPEGRIALLHSLAHIELNAIDLAFDMIVRFSTTHQVLFGDTQDFASDWLQIGDEECNHFNLLSDRLEELGSFYGALPAHDGLWQAAFDTKEDWLARLAVVPLVLEARGLDVSPQTIEKLVRFGDKKSADLLEFIYQEEIGHVAIGHKWFEWVCKAQKLEPAATFHDLVRTYFKGHLKPPFNDEARQKAGFLPIFYQPLASSV